MYKVQFFGNAISRYEVITHPTSAASRLTVTTFNYYDYRNLLRSVYKTVNDNENGWRIIAINDYFEFGQLKTKRLGQEKDEAGEWTNTPIETLRYSYNIRGWLNAINKDYANNTGIDYNDHWFGMELNYDWGFDSAQYNGNITGVKWRTKGDEQKRAFGYTYDKVNRIMGADYSTGTSFYDDFSVENFDIHMGDGQSPATAYDENGNILKMLQWGYHLTSSPLIDNLTYNYLSNSNKLLNVIDDSNDPKTKLGDFRTSTLHPESGAKDNNTTDYTYDSNGNLLKDLNKDIGTSAISGIEYNHLNLPYKITVHDSAGIKGTITYIYDGAGKKLEKRVSEHDQPEKRTTYLSGTVYENDTLQFISHEEGRIRYAKKYFVNGDSANQFIYDYFVKDHLGNVRMVLTEQRDTAQYFATMESAYRQKEDKLFYNIPQTSYPVSLVPGGYPTDNTTSPNDSLIRLNGSGKVIGPGIVLKVMGGDKVNIATKYFFRPNSSPGPVTNPLEDILTSLASGIISHAGVSKGTFSELTDPNTSVLLTAAGTFLEYNGGPSTEPVAGLCWISFDENFGRIETGFLKNNIPDELHTLSSDITPIKNGYLYIFVMNSTQNWDVFFDNLSVTHRTGELLEETHYYPFGLTMVGISSKALNFGAPENKLKYNGIEKEDGLGIDIYDAQLRELDPQIGRWWEIDPKVENMENWSPYASNYDNPIRYSDPLGDEGGECCDGFKKWFGERWEAEKRGAWLVGKWIKEAASKAGENAKNNWNAGNDPVHQAMANPMSMLMGPAGAEVNAVKTVLNAEVRVGVTEVKVIEAAENAVQKYEVGAYNELKAKSVVGDNLEIHHAPQKHPSGNLVQGYDEFTAPTIALPKIEHKAIPTFKGTQAVESTLGTTPQRAQLAKDIRDLRTYTNAPNSSLQKLIELTKKQFNGQFDKPPRINNK